MKLLDKSITIQEEMANIEAAQALGDATNPMFYEDKIDIDLNPKLWTDWMFSS